MSIFLSYIGTRIKPEISGILDGYGYEDRFCKPDGHGYGYRMIFENGYWCRYSSIRPTPIPIREADKLKVEVKSIEASKILENEKGFQLGPINGKPLKRYFPGRTNA